MWIIFKNLVRTSKKTQHVSNTEINWLILFRKKLLLVLRIIRNPYIHSVDKTQLLNVKTGVTYNSHCALNVKNTKLLTKQRKNEGRKNWIKLKSIIWKCIFQNRNKCWHKMWFPLIIGWMVINFDTSEHDSMHLSNRFVFRVTGVNLQYKKGWHVNKQTLFRLSALLLPNPTVCLLPR
jgi:hypothetical protein